VAERSKAPAWRAGLLLGGKGSNEPFWKRLKPKPAIQKIPSPAKLKMKIESYSFGEIVVGGKKFTEDIVIFKDRIKSWKRKVSHEVCLDDLKEVIKENPKILIIGLGAYGMMKVNEDVRRFLKERGIEVIEKSSEEACKLYNEMEDKNVTLAIHLTC